MNFLKDLSTEVLFIFIKNKTKQLEINNTKHIFIKINFLKINMQISYPVYTVNCSFVV